MHPTKSLHTKKTKPAPESDALTGWPAIAKFLGQPTAVAQRWAKDGMPVQRKGRSMTALPEELSKWLARETGTREPVHISQPGEEDLLQDLRRGLRQARGGKRKR